MTEYSLKQLAEYVDGEVRGDANLVVTGIGTLQSASATQIAFLANSRYKSQLESSHAGAVILSPKDVEDTPAINAIVVNNCNSSVTPVNSIIPIIATVASVGGSNLSILVTRLM